MRRVIVRFQAIERLKESLEKELEAYVYVNEVLSMESWASLTWREVSYFKFKTSRPQRDSEFGSR